MNTTNRALSAASSRGTNKYFLCTGSYIKAAFVFRECVPDSAEFPQDEIRTERTVRESIVPIHPQRDSRMIRGIDT